MKTISIVEFKAMIDRDDWKHVQELEIIHREDENVSEWNEKSQKYELFDIPYVFGSAFKISTLNDIIISYNEGFKYNEFDPSSFTANTFGMYEIWRIENISVVDEDGEKLDAHELGEYLDDDFSSIDYSELDIEQIINIDVDENNSDMETFELTISYAPDIRFTGKLLARVHDSDTNFNSLTEKWTKMSLYKTKGNKFICYHVIKSWAYEYYCSGLVCETIEDVKEFFGQGWLAEELYYEAEIEHVVEVD